MPRNRIPHPSEFITPKTPWQLLGFVSLTSAVALLTTGQLLNFVIGSIFVLLFLIYWFFVDHKQQRDPVISVERGAPKCARGLILLVSPYRTRLPDGSDSKDDLTNQLQILLDQENPSKADFGKIGILSSNLLPQINAIHYHADHEKLKDIWLICTEPDGENPGSEVSGEILKKYIECYYGPKRFLIYRDSKTTVKAENYGLIWDLAEHIFRSSGFRDDVIVADVTGGTKMMSVAIAMACVSPKRALQYMDPKRDWQGNPLQEGEMTPVGINFNPKLYPNDFNP